MVPTERLDGDVFERGGRVGSTWGDKTERAGPEGHREGRQGRVAAVSRPG